jgi:hypothetical protein
MSVKSFLYKLSFIVLLLLSNSCVLLAQDSTTLQTNASVLSTKQLAAINDKATTYNNKIDKQTEKYLQKIQKQEAKLKRKLMKLDSTAAKQLFEESQTYYADLQNKLKDKANKIKKARVTQYLPGLDSMTTSLQFLKDNPALTNTLKNANTKITDALGNYKELQNKLEVTKDITQFIKERKAMLQATLQKYNLGKKLKKYSQSVYYYEAQIAEYRAALKDPVKLQQKALALLTKIPAFNEFMQKNGILASVFGNSTNATALPNSNTAINMMGMQSRAQVQQYLTQQMGGAANAAQVVQQSVQNAQSQIASVRSSLGNSNGDIAQPDFKPNGMKTKSLKERLEYGLSVNTDKTQTYALPNNMNLGFSLGYKLREGFTLGAGANYKAGVGNSIRNIKLTNEALGFRTYMDVKFTKSNFWLSGGYEQNYMLRFNNIAILNTLSNWQYSCLLGLTKKLQLKNKGMKMQLLYDAFAKRNIPNTNTLIYRITILK